MFPHAEGGGKRLLFVWSNRFCSTASFLCLESSVAPARPRISLAAPEVARWVNLSSRTLSKIFEFMCFANIVPLLFKQAEEKIAYSLRKIH